MRSIELFAGAGGLGLGVSKSGFQPQLVVEWDKYCCDTIRENKARRTEIIASWPLIESDVRDVSFQEYEGKVDLVTGGPPCQPFSLGGKHRGQSDSRDMFPQAVRAVREVIPRAFIFENVKGLTRASFASYFEYIRLQLTYPECKRRNSESWTEHLGRLERHHTKGKYEGLKYNVVARVLNAANFGVPQKRERVFFVGLRSDVGVEWHFPEPTHSRASLLWDQSNGDYWDRHRVRKADRVLDKRISMAAVDRPKERPWRTVRDALKDLPDPEQHSLLAKAFYNHRFQPGARSYKGHTGSPMDEPAKTLKAGVHGVPGGENMLRRADGSVRYFTVRESARLQCFPDDFVFHGSWSETMRQLGNAVPVDLGRIVANDIAKVLRRPKIK